MGAREEGTGAQPPPATATTACCWKGTFKSPQKPSFSGNLRASKQMHPLALHCALGLVVTRAGQTLPPPVEGAHQNQPEDLQSWRD